MGRTLEAATGIRKFWGGGKEGGAGRGGKWGGEGGGVLWAGCANGGKFRLIIVFILFYFIFCPGINTLTLLNKVGASGIKFQPAFCH
jgi:hypothetical protein